MSITAPSPLIRLDAPLPQPRSYTLLATATIPSTDARWEGGANLHGHPEGPASVFDPCATGTSRTKTLEALTPSERALVFTVYKGATCTARSIGSDPTWYTDRLRLAFQAVESEAVERVFAEGRPDSDIPGAYLGDTNLEILNGGTAVAPTEALALLEEEIATVGAGMIHAAPATATYWFCNGCLTARAPRLFTGLGTPVVVGAGYIGVRPDAAQGTPAAGNEWAFASGPVQVYRTPEVEVMPASYAQSLDRTSNDVAFIAERDYLISWIGRQDSSDDNHIQAGVLVDRL